MGPGVGRASSTKDIVIIKAFGNSSMVSHHGRFKRKSMLEQS